MENSVTKYRTENDLYRTKEQMISDMLLIFSSNDLSLGSKNAFINNLLYEWTEYHGKFIGCKYWSRKALMLWLEDKKGCVRVLRHEHVVPRKLVKSMLSEKLKDHNNTKEDMYQFLQKNLIGVVVTKEEDDMLRSLGYVSKMPNTNDVWSRYNIPNHQIDVCYVTWERIGKRISLLNYIGINTNDWDQELGNIEKSKQTYMVKSKEILDIYNEILEDKDFLDNVLPGAIEIIAEIQSKIDAWEVSTEPEFIKPYYMLEDSDIRRKYNLIANAGVALTSISSFRSYMNRSETLEKINELLVLVKNSSDHMELCWHLNRIGFIERLRQTSYDEEIKSRPFQLVNRFMLSIFIENFTTIANIDKLKETYELFVKSFGFEATYGENQYECMHISIMNTVNMCLNEQGILFNKEDQEYWKKVFIRACIPWRYHERSTQIKCK